MLSAFGRHEYDEIWYNVDQMAKWQTILTDVLMF